jgi:ubiquinone/menaquinone biosynthesis C-methylase UbiE
LLDHTLSRARERDLQNITPTQGDARRLPYANASFDAAYLVAVLGEIPDQEAALRELARVHTPGGRLDFPRFDGHLRAEPTGLAGRMSSDGKWEGKAAVSGRVQG